MKKDAEHTLSETSPLTGSDSGRLTLKRSRLACADHGDTPTRRTPQAREGCNRLKLKCNVARPCRACFRRGIPCIPKDRKPDACVQCRSRKIKCDLQCPCNNCIRKGRRCSFGHDEREPQTSTSTGLLAQSILSPAFRNNQQSLDVAPNWIRGLPLDDNDPFG